MIEKGRISALQMAIIMHPTISATAILIVPSITGKFAKQDLWLSPIWALFAGFLTIYLAYQLNKHFPKQTVIQYSEEILGVIPGKVIGFLYLFFYVFITGIMLREYGEFVVGNFLMTTPLIVVIISMTIVCALAVHGGLEVIARTAQFFLPIVLAVLLFIAIIMIPDLQLKHMFPIMEKGLMPSIKGAVTPSGWFSEFFLLSFLFPFLLEREKGFKWGMISAFLVMLMLVITNFYALFLFGDITDMSIYPVMSVTKYISIADFLQHVESIVMAIWIPGVFIKISVFYYVIVIGTAQWLNLSDYRPLVLPIGFLLVVFSIWSIHSLMELIDVLMNLWSMFWLYHLLIPALLLFITFIRKGMVGKREERNNKKMLSGKR